MKQSNKALSPFFIGLRTFPLCNITILDCVDSTNEWLKQNGTKHGQIVLAREQTGGKGTKGRSFFSPKDTGLYLSMLFTQKLTQEHLSLLTLAAAVAVSESLEIICGVNAKIRWVNDIFVNDKKVCGILTESKVSPDGNPESIIVGIGINLFEPKNSFGELSDIAGAVLKKGSSFLFNSLSAEIINRLKIYFDGINNTDFLKIYREKCFILNKSISVTTPTGCFDAIANEIDNLGRLTVTDVSGQLHTLCSADVSIKETEKPM